MSIRGIALVVVDADVDVNGNEVLWAAAFRLTTRITMDNRRANRRERVRLLPKLRAVGGPGQKFSQVSC